jgi:hypothetical protein
MSAAPPAGDRGTRPGPAPQNLTSGQSRTYNKVVEPVTSAGPLGTFVTSNDTGPDQRSA